MKPRYAIAGLLILAVGLECGYKIGRNVKAIEDSRTIYVLRKEVERFHDPQVFHAAEDVARITGRPLFQVLSGKLDPRFNYKKGRNIS